MTSIRDKCVVGDRYGTIRLTAWLVQQMWCSLASDALLMIHSGRIEVNGYVAMSEMALRSRDVVTRTGPSDAQQELW